MALVYPTPPIPLSTAHLLAAFFTFSYVGSLYLSRSARLSFKKEASFTVRDGEERTKESDERWRSDPDVIRARLLAASASTLLSVYAVYWLVQRVMLEYEVCTRQRLAKPPLRVWYCCSCQRAMTKNAPAWRSRYSLPLRQ